MMRILHITPSIFEGGIEKVIFNLSTEIDANKYEVIVACYNQGKMFNKLEEAGVKCYRLNKVVSKPIQKIVQIANIIEKYEIDIVHCHFCFDGVLAAYLNGIKSVNTIHSIYREDCYAIDYIQTRYEMKLSDKIICVSEPVLRNSVEALGASPDKCQIISNWANAPTKGWKFDTDDFYIGCIARISEEKKLEDIIFAAKCLPQYKFIIYGNCVNEDRDHEKKYYERIKLLAQQTPNLAIKEFNISQATEAYSTIGIFLMTSKFEGSPIAPMEAIMHGCCFVGYPVGDIRQNINDGINGYLVNDRESMIRCIANLMSNKEGLNKIRINNIQKQFPSGIHQYEAVYKQLLNK